MILILFVWGCNQHIELENNQTPPSNFVPQGIDQDGDGVFIEDGDCDDTNPQTYPGAPEICDGEDNDCDRILDESDPDLDQSTLIQQFRDRDGDGYGQTALSAKSCFLRAGYSLRSEDCNDDAPLIYPQAPEICDLIDNDCDQLVDQDDPNLIPTRWFEDKDEDESGSNTDFLDIDDCSSPPGFVLEAGDCEDNNPEIHGLDSDADGYSLCEQDCDDLDSLRSPGALERCDGIDNNCNSKIDNKDEAVYGSYWYKDSDQDGFGNPTDVYLQPDCTEPFGWADNREDCADNDPSINPNTLEICNNGLDDDCDGAIDCADPDCFDTSDCPLFLQEVCAEEADSFLVLNNTSGLLPAALMGTQQTLYALDRILFDGQNNQWQAPQAITTLSTLNDPNGSQSIDVFLSTQEQGFFFSSTSTSLSPIQTIEYGGTHAVSCENTLYVFDETNIRIVEGGSLSFPSLSTSTLCLDRDQDGSFELWFAVPSQGTLYSWNPNNETAQTELSFPISQHVLLSELGDINNDTKEDFLLAYDQSPIHLIVNTTTSINEHMINHPYDQSWRSVTSADTDGDGLKEMIISTSISSTLEQNQGQVVFLSGEKIQESLSGPMDLLDIGTILYTPMMNSQFGHDIISTTTRLLITAPEYHLKGEERGALYQYTYPLFSNHLSFPDDDNDRFGALVSPTATCRVPPMTTFKYGDCNDERVQTYPNALEQCTNGIDDNCDGYIDSLDRECQSDAQENCIDQLDNDEDGFIDCSDPECMGTLLCGADILITAGTVQRTLFASPDSTCSDDVCTQNPEGYCSLSIQAQGEARNPVEAQNYESCSFTLNLEYNSTTANCSTLIQTEQTFSSACLEEIESIPENISGDHFGTVHTINSNGLFLLSAAQERYEDNMYIWEAPLLPHPTK